MISHKIINLIAGLAVLVMGLLPIDMFLGWYLLIYGGSFLMYAMFKIGLLLLGLLVLFFWVGIITAGISDMRK